MTEPAAAGPTPVVALHSLFFDGSMFDAVEVRCGRRFLAPDHRGQGVRAHDGAAPTLAGIVDDLAARLRARGTPVDLVGSSMGAYLAILLADREPGLVRSVVLSAATGDAEQRPEKFAALVARLRDPGPAAMVDQLCSTMFGDAFLDSAPGTPARVALERWRAHFAALDPGVAKAAHEVFARDALWPELDRLDRPVLLLAGRLDRAKSPADMAAIADRIGCPAPVVFERSGHTPFVEQPDEVAAELSRWWALLDARAAP